jgi:hypothetical protein
MRNKSLYNSKSQHYIFKKTNKLKTVLTNIIWCIWSIQIFDETLFYLYLKNANSNTILSNIISNQALTIIMLIIIIITQ